MTLKDLRSNRDASLAAAIALPKAVAKTVPATVQQPDRPANPLATD